MFEKYLKPKYCKTKTDRRDYKGERYFKYYDRGDTVVQVVFNPGEERKGRSNTFGIHIIARMTLMQNYVVHGYTEPCTKKEYELKFNEIVKMLK